MVFYFQFGYHGPDAWQQVKNDPDFDFESTGVLRIVAESEAGAFEWGVTVANWYLARLHSSNSDYEWSRGDYAVWIEVENPELDGDEDLIEVQVGEFPEFEALRRYLSD